MAAASQCPSSLLTGDNSGYGLKAFNCVFVVKAYVFLGLTGFTGHLQHRQSLCAQCHVWTDEVRLEDKREFLVVGCCHLQKDLGLRGCRSNELSCQVNCPWTDH